MEQIEITIIKEGKDILITSTEGRQIKITQNNNLDNITIDAGNCIEVKCQVELANLSPENINVECYYGKILENGVVEDISIIPMKLKTKDNKANKENKENKDNNEGPKIYEYETKIELKTGGNYGYTFRIMPKHEMLLEPENLNLIKWITK